ncbi:pleckstrin homology-like domain-containing protein [Engraulis encrasicolus]|uniref:pleckstrin homology-like domain-containing protein n=1 Tax=Engraulis encrasicolus TaxID=184585 RepID=UPI002FD4E152
MPLSALCFLSSPLGHQHQCAPLTAMAVVSATSNGSVENTGERVGKRGWLLKRSHFTHRWKRAWFELQDNILVYGDDEKRACKQINLLGAEMVLLKGEASSSCCGWTVTPSADGSRHRHQHRTYFLRASTAEEQQQWMEAICEARMRAGEQMPHACVLQ